QPFVAIQWIEPCFSSAAPERSKQTLTPRQTKRLLILATRIGVEQLEPRRKPDCPTARHHRDIHHRQLWTYRLRIAGQRAWGFEIEGDRGTAAAAGQVDVKMVRVQIDQTLWNG